mmetsp:Transcript_26899/g.66590  ORF Transcript_26899/g.66590 Transcript_26899/m.66590 type:complete len:116 (+) Transcript_26899:729-1076(+)
MRAIPSHPVLHVVVSYAASALQQHYPWLRRALRADFELLDGKRYAHAARSTGSNHVAVIRDSNQGALTCQSNDSRMAIALHLHSNRMAITVRSRALQINGGADVSNQFPVSPCVT